MRERVDFRKIAEEFRELASYATNPSDAKDFLFIARGYEELARKSVDNSERMAGRDAAGYATRRTH